MIKQNSKIIISEWSGRLGNNVIQFSNGIYICLKTNSHLDYPNHKFFKSHDLNFSQGKICNHYMTRFYDPTDCFSIYPSIAERRYILQNYVKGLLTFNIDVHQFPKSSHRKKLVIQMRSGELFLKNPNPKYVPSPLSYFTKIIEENGYDDVLIVCEDRTNPVIGKLEEMYSFCNVQSSDLVSDMRTIANAEHLCTTVGTFGFMLTLFNNRLKRLYVDNIPKDLLDFGYFDSQNRDLNFDVVKYDIQDYIKFGYWKNTSEQYNLVFNLPKEKVVRL